MTVFLICAFRAFCGSRSSERKPQNTQKARNTLRVIDTSCILSLFFLIPTFVISATSQELPNQIRGYKVHRDKITVSTSPDLPKNASTDAIVKIGDPDLVDVGISGVNFTLSAEIKPLAQSGKVDFLTFHDFRVNGIAVTVEEYVHPFGSKRISRSTFPNLP